VVKSLGHNLLPSITGVKNGRSNTTLLPLPL